MSMTVDTESLRGALSQDWRAELPFQASSMHFESLSEVQAPNLGLAIREGMGTPGSIRRRTNQPGIATDR